MKIGPKELALRASREVQPAPAKVQKAAEGGKWDRKAYMREYMRKRRTEAKK